MEGGRNRASIVEEPIDSVVVAQPIPEPAAVRTASPGSPVDL
jgi:hypothetical protein